MYFFVYMYDVFFYVCMTYFVCMFRRYNLFIVVIYFRGGDDNGGDVDGVFFLCYIFLNGLDLKNWMRMYIDIINIIFKI